VALVPRCYTSGAPTAAFTLPLTAWTNAGQGAAGTAPAAGDIVLVITETNSSTATLSVTPSGVWTTKETDVLSSSGVIAAVYRIFDGTETAPTFTWSAGARQTWVAVALAPDTGNTVSIDVWATTKVDGTAGTSHTPNAATAAGTGEVSVVLCTARASASGTTAITITPATNWTTTTTASFAGSASVASWASEVAFRTGQGSGSIAPGAFTTNVSTTMVLFHVLVKEAAAGAPAGNAALLGIRRPGGLVGNRSQRLGGRARY
jgi:hypothetical protein